MDDTYLYLNGRLVMANPALRRGPAPFDFSRLYGREKYSLSNFILNAGNAPEGDELPEGLRSFDVWSDRVPTDWSREATGIESAEYGEAWWHGVSLDNLLLFAKRTAGVVGIDPNLATAAHIVRFTGGDQYPVFRLDIIYQS